MGYRGVDEGRCLTPRFDPHFLRLNRVTSHFRPQLLNGKRFRPAIDRATNAVNIISGCLHISEALRCAPDLNPIVGVCLGAGLNPAGPRSWRIDVRCWNATLTYGNRDRRLWTFDGLGRHGRLQWRVWLWLSRLLQHRSGSVGKRLLMASLVLATLFLPATARLAHDGPGILYRALVIKVSNGPLRHTGRWIRRS